MKVQEAIEMLQKFHKPNEDIVVTWFSKDEFRDGKLTDEMWEDVCNRADHKIDSCGLADDIEYIIQWVNGEL